MDNTNSNLNPKVQSFLEALRQRSQNNQEQSPGLSFNEFKEKKKLEESRKEQFFKARSREFNEVYDQKKSQEAKRIEQLIQQLRMLAKSVNKLGNELENAVEVPVTEPSVYQASFIDHLFEMIDLMKQQIDRSSTWLNIFNSKQAKKGFYWSQVKSQGSKFMLSQERVIATSMG